MLRNLNSLAAPRLRPESHPPPPRLNVPPFTVRLRLVTISSTRWVATKWNSSEVNVKEKQNTTGCNQLQHTTQKWPCPIRLVPSDLPIHIFCRSLQLSSAQHHHSAPKVSDFYPLFCCCSSCLVTNGFAERAVVGSDFVLLSLPWYCRF